LGSEGHQELGQKEEKSLLSRKSGDGAKTPPQAVRRHEGNKGKKDMAKGRKKGTSQASTRFMGFQREKKSKNGNPTM